MCMYNFMVMYHIRDLLAWSIIVWITHQHKAQPHNCITVSRFCMALLQSTPAHIGRHQNATEHIYVWNICLYINGWIFDWPYKCATFDKVAFTNIPIVCFIIASEIVDTNTPLGSVLKANNAQFFRDLFVTRCHSLCCVSMHNAGSRVRYNTSPL